MIHTLEEAQRLLDLNIEVAKGESDAANIALVDGDYKTAHLAFAAASQAMWNVRAYDDHIQRLLFPPGDPVDAVAEFLGDDA